MKWMWSLKATTKTAISGRPLMKFESDTMWRLCLMEASLELSLMRLRCCLVGSFLFWTRLTATLLDLFIAIAIYSLPKLVAGSAEGYSGHVDGRPKEAKLNHPKGFTVDDKGNIYVADIDNMAIRRLSDTESQQLLGANGAKVVDMYLVVPREDEPPSIDTRTPTPRKTYPFMSKDSEKMPQIRQSRVFYRGLEGDQQQQQPQQRHQHHHMQHTSASQTVYEQSSENTEEIVFGAVQEKEVKRRSVLTKPIDYETSFYDHSSISYGYNSMGYVYGPYS